MFCIYRQYTHSHCVVAADLKCQIIKPSESKGNMTILMLIFPFSAHSKHFTTLTHNSLYSSISRLIARGYFHWSRSRCRCHSDKRRHADAAGLDAHQRYTFVLFSSFLSTLNPLISSMSPAQMIETSPHSAALAIQTTFSRPFASKTARCVCLWPPCSLVNTTVY